MSSSPPLILAKLREAMEEAPPEVRPRLLAALILDLSTVEVVPSIAHREAGNPEFLTPDGAAAIAKMSKRKLMDLTKGQAFRRGLGHRTVRFEAVGFHRWLRTSAGR